MLRTTLAGLRAHKLRLLASGMAIVLGVGFVAGTLIFADTARTGLFNEFASQAKNVSAAVESPSQADNAKGKANPPPLPETLLPVARRLPGAAAAEGRMAGPAALLGKNGRLVANGRRTGVAVDAPADPRFRWLTIASGRMPQTAGEALLDADTASTTHYTVGDTVTVLDARGQRHQLQLVGIANLGVAKGLNDTSVLALNLAGMHALDIHGYDRIDVAAAPGVSQTALAAELSRAVAGAAPAGSAVVTGAKLAHDLANNVVRQVDIILTAILVFAIVALFVAAIVILNTFNILVTQRLRELALVRCVGATTRQVFGSVVLESFVVGLVASAIGVGVGVGITLALTALFGALGAAIPAGTGIAVTPQTLLISILGGTGVTLAAALWPAWRATRVAPVAALRAPTETPVGLVRRRVGSIATASVFCAAGVGLAALGLPRGQSGLLIEAAGGLVFFVGVLVASPLLVGPLARLLGWLPGKVLGVPTRLATLNTSRNPGRSAATMIALTIGVGLMTLFAVVTSTARSFAFAQVDQHYPIDYLLSPLSVAAGDRTQPTLPGSLVVALRQQPQFAVAAPSWNGTGTVNGHTAAITAVDPSAYGTAVKPQVSAGSLTPLRSGSGGIALESKLATALHVQVGDDVTVGTTGRSERLRVTALSPSDFFGGAALISAQDYARGFRPAGADDILVKAKAGVSAATSRAAVDRATVGYPQTAVQSVANYKNRITSAINALLALFGGLLAIAIIIALFGIANTLSLSVIERTRESGLLRALGLTKAQLRRTLSAEALFLGLMGGLIGVVVGAGFGWAVADTFIRGAGGGSGVTYPIAMIAGFLALAGLAGLAAGVLPARRAARASIIEAIADV